jgi:hypothetical protein
VDDVEIGDKGGSNEINDLDVDDDDDDDNNDVVDLHALEPSGE